MSEAEKLNPLAKAFREEATQRARQFAGDEVWALMNPSQRAQVVDAARLVMRMEYAMAGVV